MTEAELIEWGCRERERFHRELHTQINAWTAARDSEARARGLNPDDQTDEGKAAAIASLVKSVAVQMRASPEPCSTLEEWCEWRRREDDRMVREVVEQLDSWFDLHVRGVTVQ